MGESASGGTKRVALFVDGDNLQCSLAAPILEAAGRLGQVDVRRVYAAESGFRNWSGAAGYRMIQVCGAKNGTDLLLCIEAVELACKGGFDAFVIVSDDRDFSHLATWLRERGYMVLGLGTARSPDDWRATCSAFAVLETADEPLKPAPANVPVIRLPENPSDLNVKTKDRGRVDSQATNSRRQSDAPTLQPLSPVDSQLRMVIAQSPRGVALQAVGCIMGKAKYQPPTGRDWRSYMATRLDLYSLDPKGPKARVRWVGPQK